MKRRRNHFLIGLLSAAITFGALSVFAGRPHWQRHGWGHRYHCNTNERVGNTPADLQKQDQ